MCYYFDDIIRSTGINFRNILLHEKSHKKYDIILICEISYETCMGSILMRNRFSGIDGFIKIYDEIRYLSLFGYSWYDEICDRIKYLISKKSGIKDSINYNFARIRIDSYSSLAIEKILTFHNVIILIKSVVNENKNYYC